MAALSKVGSIAGRENITGSSSDNEMHRSGSTSMW